MAKCFYTECFETWDGTEGGKGIGDDSTWHVYNVTQNHNIPPSAVLEIALYNEYPIESYNVGIRSTPNQGEPQDFRLINLSERDKGYNCVTAHVQLDTSGCLMYYAEYYNRVHFDILGYWLGCDYIDTFDEFTPSSPSGWENYELDQHGVSSGNIAEIAMINSFSGTPHIMGVRTSGSTIDNRKFEIKQSRDDGIVAISTLAHASKDAAGINIWASDTSGCSFRLLGYFSTPPGDYTESFIDFNEPTSQGIWTTLNVGSSGLSGNVSQFSIGQQIDDDINVGVREYNSNIDNRKFFLDSIDAVESGFTWGTLHSNVNSDGIVEYFCDDISDSPPYTVVGYWDNFVESSWPFTKAGSVDCFIEGRNPFIHYIENNPQIFNAATGSVWEKYSLSDNWNIPASTDSEPIVAEIVISNISPTATYSAGARSVSSSHDRKFQMHDAEGGGVDSISLLTPVDTGGDIEIYAGHLSNIRFEVAGYWVGGTYVDVVDGFTAGSSSSWVTKNLGSQYEDKVLETVITNTSSLNVLRTAGVRSVGNSTNRYFTMTKAETGDTNVSTHVIASGINGTIEAYASSNSDIDFSVVGYWDVPPGKYNETFTDISNLTQNGVWQQVDAGVSFSGIVEIVLENRDNNAQRYMGAREIGSNNNRRWRIRETDLLETGNAGKGSRVFTNISSGTHVELYHGFRTDAHAFRKVGYWDNLNYIPTQVSGNCPLFITGHAQYNVIDEANYPSGLTMYISGSPPVASDNITLYMSGIPAFIDSSGQYPSGVPLWIYGIQKSPPLDLFINGYINYSGSNDLYICGTNMVSGVVNLFTISSEQQVASGDLFISSHDSANESIDLFLKAPEPSNGQITLYIHNPIDPGSGLIREENAIFYLSRRHHSKTDTALDRIENISWDFPDLLIGNKSFLEQSGVNITVGDGTLPKYNDMGGGFSSCLLGQALVGNIPKQQNVMGHVVSPSDYPYAGSGSITTAFWMSGAKTSGNIVEAGWFYRDSADFGNVSNGFNDHTLGVKITSESGLQILTSIRDLPYDQVSGGGLWWGGTTHYGTPTGTDWTWRSPDEYWAWNEEWPEIYIERNDNAFFIIRSEFIPSGVDNGHPNHMKVWLSIDGDPWVYIGSGITGPPASSLYSFSDPRNRRAENAVGIKVQAVNNDANNESLSTNEIVLWTDSDRFNNDELSDLHSIAFNYYRPLDEYKPTIVPPSTYIRRTIGSFEYEPIIPGIEYNPGEVCSGLKVTLEVGIGDYGEDASAYLLEEVPPSGFYITNITPHADITYPSQGSRPETQQQIFHDPQSGIMEPYNHELNINSYGASIRWVNHDNHPQKDERRIPTPTGIYTYDLYPIYPYGIPRIDDFSFDGSGLFFGGSTGSGIFSVQTTGDTSGSTSGIDGCAVSFGCDLYIQGPSQSSGITNLYIRTQEKFTSAYIGTSPRTPEITDFIFEADGNANLEFLAGIEYGPSLYTKGPVQYEDSCPLVIFGPAGDNIFLFIHGHDSYNSNNDYPSGMLLRIGDGHEIASGSCDLFIQGPTPYSGQINLYTKAGAFEPPIDLFIEGHIPFNNEISGYIKGPEFICSSGSFDYPGNPDDFSFPYGDLSPTLYIKGLDSSSGTCPLYIGPGRVRSSWTLYLKTESNDVNNIANLFIHGFSGVSGINQAFNNIPLYLEAVDSDYPYTAGGTRNWTIFLRAQSGNITNNNSWIMFLKADSIALSTCNLYTYGHASGSLPHGNEINSSVNFICSANPDDPTRIGFIPHNSDDDPWTLFLKCNPGHSDTIPFYISGSIPIIYSASGDLFVEGLFGQKTGTVPLYLMGVSGLINNGPSGLHLFIDAGTLVYNTSGNLYTHGY